MFKETYTMTRFISFVFMLYSLVCGGTNIISDAIEDMYRKGETTPTKY